jgi:hypothetical protein
VSELRGKGSVRCRKDARARCWRYGWVRCWRDSWVRCKREGWGWVSVGGRIGSGVGGDEHGLGTGGIVGSDVRRLVRCRG